MLPISAIISQHPLPSSMLPGPPSPYPTFCPAGSDLSAASYQSLRSRYQNGDWTTTTDHLLLVTVHRWGYVVVVVGTEVDWGGDS